MAHHMICRCIHIVHNIAISGTDTYRAPRDRAIDYSPPSPGAPGVRVSQKYKYNKNYLNQFEIK